MVFLMHGDIFKYSNSITAYILLASTLAHWAIELKN